MIQFNSIRISTAVFAQLVGLFFLVVSLSLYLSQSEFANELEKNTYLLGFGFSLLRGFGAMLISWLAILSLLRSSYRQQVQTLCVSGMAISTLLLTLCCVQ